MPITKTKFWAYEKEKRKGLIKINRIQFSLFLYLTKFKNISHIHYATFFNENVAYVQYAQEYMSFESFMEDLISISTEDNLEIEIDAWDINKNGQYIETDHREQIWKELKASPYLLWNINEIANKQLDDVENSIGRIRSFQEHVEALHTYTDALFGIKVD